MYPSVPALPDKTKAQTGVSALGRLLLGSLHRSPHRHEVRVDFVLEASLVETECLTACGDRIEIRGVRFKSLDGKRQAVRGLLGKPQPRRLPVPTPRKDRFCGAATAASAS